MSVERVFVTLYNTDTQIASEDALNKLKACLSSRPTHSFNEGTRVSSATVAQRKSRCLGS